MAIRVGTCSWTDTTMVAAWYPKDIRTAESRLRYYAAHFDTVEIDSTFYALPHARTVELWAERTPPEFMFHVKAFGMMTRHGVKPEQLPPGLRESHDYEVDKHGRIAKPAPALRASVFEWFSAALEPLRSAGKLGLTLLQFPPYFRASDAARSYIVEAAERLHPDPIAVEFRHVSWVEPSEADRTFDLLRNLGATYVCVDTPRIQDSSVLPPLAVTTSPLAYVRFHGRNATTWHSRTGSAAQRFKYLYEPQELAEWREPLLSISRRAGETYVLFNNCYADYAPRNAQQMMSLLDRALPRE